MKRNVYRIEDTRQGREEQQQREVVSGAILNVARELRRLEKLTDEQQDRNGSGDRVS